MGDRTMTMANLSQELQQVTADLHQVNPWIGLSRFSIIGLIFISLVIFAWSLPQLNFFIFATILAGIFYAFWFLCTHDMIHQTLTGWTWFDSLLPRLISWPMLWPHNLYAEMHRLHHGWNGIDLRDPERVQWTWQEYEQANPFLRWYVRHQWVCDIFVLAGFGMIFKTFINAWHFQEFVPRIRRQFLLDVTGILVVQSLLLTLAISQGVLLRYLLFWLILERVIGAISQTRDHLEHYALWGSFKGHQLTQFYACRNIKTSHLVGWLMGGLNYHGVHHALPHIPFNQLPEAFTRTQKLLQKYDLPPMQMQTGYLKSTYWLSCHPSLIGEVDNSDTTNRYQMISV